MKNYFWLLCVLTAFFGFGCATDTTYLIKKPYLYEFTKNSKTGYILGSIHVGVHIDDLPQGFWKYVDRSQIVITEADMTTKEASEQLEKNLRRKMTRGENDPEVLSHFTSGEITQISDRFDELKPGFSELLPSASMYGIASVIDSTSDKIYVGQLKHGEYVRTRTKFSMDRNIRAYAKSKGKYTDSLDDVNSEDFLSCLVGTDKSNLKFIRERLTKDTIYRSAEALIALHEDYRKGDSTKLIQDLKKVPNCLLAGRNKQWLEKIKSIAEYYQQPLFVVGVGHLVDEKDSVLDLLKESGYLVRRIEELDTK